MEKPPPFKTYKLPYLMTIAWIISIIITIYYIITPTTQFKNYDYYYPKILTGIGVMMGVIVAVTIFYLGKVHDYLHDYLKQDGMINEIKDIVVERLEKLQSKALQDDFNNLNKDFGKTEDFLSSMPRFILKISLANLLALAFIAIQYVVFKSSTVGHFISFLSLLVTTIIIFVILWIEYEHIILLFHKTLKIQIIHIIDYKKFLNTIGVTKQLSQDKK